MADARFAALAFRSGPLAVIATAAAAAAVLGPEWSHAAAPAPWLVAVGLVGLPHGAADLAVGWKLCPRAALVSACAAYVVVMAATTIAFLLAPVFTVGGFVVLSAWHFGLPHGGIAVGVPLTAWPRESGRVGERLLELAGEATPTFPASAVRGCGACILAVGLAALAFSAMRHARASRGGLLCDAVELTAIAALGLVADPLFSVGLTFLAWHAWRQMEPLATIVTGAAPTSPWSLARSLVAIHAAALPLLVPTWIAIAYGWWRLSPDRSAVDLAILSIAAYLVVTPAHEALGAAIRSGMLDRRGPAAKPTRPPDVCQSPSIARCAENPASSSG